MLLSSALVLTALVHQATFESSDALAPSLHQSRRRFARGASSSALSYSHGEHGGESYFSPLPSPRQRRHQRSEANRHRMQQKLDDEAADPPTDESSRQQRHVPLRAMPHVQIESQEAATRAGYIIRQRKMSLEGNGNQNQTQNSARTMRSNRQLDQPSNSPRLEQEDPNRIIGIQAPSLEFHVRNRFSDNRRSRLSLSKQPQLDEFLDRPEKLKPVEEQRKGARRVTFKATREASKPLVSKPVATLTEYMTQPVSQYSLFSFHDAEESNNQSKDSNQPKARRWLVRRLTAEESQHYIQSASSGKDGVMDESNLFRLAVPLLPLIGWDLTPVIDLEVIPPKTMNDCALIDAVNIDETATETYGADSGGQAKWEPLKGIRKRMQGDGQMDGIDGDAADRPPVVKIRSLRVSLLSTQEEVKEVMSKSNGNSNLKEKDRKMQKEAIDMVGKVEEWLRPHITFEAELSWNDILTSVGSAENESSVTVESTAITSLSIPKIPTDILRATVPSSFLVKRLGATLTSQALAICLPRFLRQLEKDYDRWSGLGVSDNMEKK